MNGWDEIRALAEEWVDSDASLVYRLSGRGRYRAYADNLPYVKLRGDSAAGRP